MQKLNVIYRLFFQLNKKIFTIEQQPVTDKMKTKTHNVKSILIIQTAFIGDVILTTPLIRETKRAFPTADIDVMVIPQTKGVLENNPHIRSLLVFDKRGRKLRAFCQMAAHLRKQKYDFAFAAHRSMTTAWLMIFGGIKNRLGFTGKSSAWLMSDRVTFRQEKKQIDRYLDFLRHLGIHKVRRQSELFFNAAIEQQVDTLLSDLIPENPTMVIAPGSVRATKRWPEEYFAELLCRLSALPLNLILLGSPGEKALCDDILARSKAVGVLNLSGKTSLLEAAAVIKKSDLLLCNDSGTMHMANAVETDLFAFFGPTIEWFGFGPFRAGDRIFQVDLYCRPCGTHGGKACPEGHFRCMRDISVDEVFRAITKRFKL